MNSTMNGDAGLSAVEARDWSVFLWAGIAVAILGLLAVAFPLVTGLSLSIGLGALLVIGGFAHVAHAFSGRGWRSFLYQTILAVVYVAAGIGLLANPVVGLASLTILLAAFLAVDGLVEIGMGLRMRSVHSSWGTYAVSGALGLVAAGLIYVGWPTSAAWAVGLLLGVNLFATGATMIFVSRAGRRAMARESATTVEHARGA